MTGIGPDDAGTGRAPRWPVLVGVGTLLSGLAGNIASNLLSELAGALGPVSIALAVGGAILSIVFEVRRRRAERQAATEPTGTIAAAPTGAPTLPYSAGFTGRAEDVASIVDAIDREHAVVVVGRRAVGTSSCAVRAANVRRDDFPDGQFYLDLRDGDRPRSTREVLTALARVLGTTPPATGRTEDLTSAAEAVRGQLDGRRILLVLDNVDLPSQVRPLLPPTARTCRLLLVGAPALADLAGVVAHWLSEPGQDDSVELFAAAGRATPAASTSRRADPATDPAVRRIVEICGRQPRTIRALGYRAARHGWRSDDLLEALHRAVTAPPHQRVSNSPAVTLLTERDSAYDALSAGARRLYRLMALGPAALDRAAIAALAGRRPRQVAALLEELATAAFLVGAAGDRYEIRPLLVPYARLHLREGEPVWRRVSAQARLARHLARRAERHTTSLAVTATAAGRERALPLGDDPASWLELHQDLLLAVVKVPAGAARALPRRLRRWWFRLAVALSGWYAHEGRVDEWAEVCRIVLDTPTADDRPEIAGWAHNELGVLRRRRGDPRGATAALTLAVAERGRRGGAQVRLNLGLALLDLGQVDEAIEQLAHSRRHRAGRDRAGHALTDLGLGVARLARDEPEAARRHLVRAANAFRRLGESRGYAAALANLVLAYHRLGEYLDAAQAGRAALHEYTQNVPDPVARASALLNSGAALVSATGSPAGPAYDLLDQSRRLREQWPPTAGLGRTLLYLGDAAAALGRPAEARRHWVRAAEVCRSVADPAGLTAAEGRLADATPAQLG